MHHAAFALNQTRQDSRRADCRRGRLGLDWQRNGRLRGRDLAQQQPAWIGARPRP